MSESDKLPTLADLRLRRGAPRSNIRRNAKTREPQSSSLLDLFPDPAPLPEETPAEVLSVSGVPHAAVIVPAAQPVQVQKDVPQISRAQAKEPRVWSVAALVRRVRGLVEQSFAGTVAVEGEISNWRPAGSGHCYFTLKGGDAQLSVVMFRTQALRVTFRPKDGDAVRLRGQLSVYENRGQMQLVAASMELAGLGAQLAAVQELKAHLREEGLFDRKRPLPAFPKCIGVITSLQGAALRDIVKVCRRRHAAINLLIYPAAVQGPRCPAEVVAGLRWFNAHPERADVLLIARGGGSWEDLHGFDDEGVVRAIAGCALPVIVGVGHATDSTIADAAADLCAPTPSAAAELVTAAQHKVEERVERLRARAMRAGSYELLRARQRLLRVGSEATLRRVLDSLTQRVQRLDELGFRLEAAARARVRAGGTAWQASESRLRARDAGRQLPELFRREERLRTRLNTAAKSSIAQRQARMQAAAFQLGALSPLRVLERGYALVYAADGSLLRSAAQTSEGHTVRARLAKGSFHARVETVNQNG